MKIKDMIQNAMDQGYQDDDASAKVCQDLPMDLFKKEGYNIKGWRLVKSGSVGPVLTDFPGVYVTEDMDFVAVLE